MSKRTCTTAAMICGLAAMAVLAGCGGDSPAPVAPTPEASVPQPMRARTSQQVTLPYEVNSQTTREYPSTLVPPAPGVTDW